jgi:hypothetical protein
MIYTIEPIMGYSEKGRPKKNAQPSCLGYRLNTSIVSALYKIKAATDCLGRFILASNEMDRNRLPDSELLREYKSQTHIRLLSKPVIM